MYMYIKRLANLDILKQLLTPLFDENLSQNILF